MEPSQHRSLLKAMMHPGFYPRRVDAVKRCETHISTVFLTGPYAYKIKKPVSFGFLDFSSPEKRAVYCFEEVSLNRRLPSGVYRDVVPIACHEGKYVINGAGEMVEHDVKMRPLDEEDAMLARLQRAELGNREIEELADLLIGFYTTTPPATQEEGFLAWEDNFKLMEAFAGEIIDGHRFAFIRSAMSIFFKKHQRLFQQRKHGGKIREGHGDLRSEHIYFTRDGIQIIDCIEFSDRLRIVDVISDLAFLSMDLEHRHFASQARLLLRRYVNRTGGAGALPLLDFYHCYRAMVRCKVNCFRLREIGMSSPHRSTLKAAADDYLNLAHRYAATLSRPLLWIVCGLPASGKSTIAKALASVQDIDVIRSDVVRKALCAGQVEPAGNHSLESGLYSSYATVVTYDERFRVARETLKKGQSIVIDATFSRQGQRNEAPRLATERQATPVFLECRAPDAILAQRLQKRETDRRFPMPG
jgi:aminoglycoside phosphotransferase family enzyme/predicted kinase